VKLDAHWLRDAPAATAAEERAGLDERVLPGVLVHYWRHDAFTIRNRCYLTADGMFCMDFLKMDNKTVLMRRIFRRKK
jgi:hypothetical protein